MGRGLYVKHKVIAAGVPNATQNYIETKQGECPFMTHISTHSIDDVEDGTPIARVADDSRKGEQLNA
jgi:hypothetical protein